MKQRINSRFQNIKLWLRHPTELLVVGSIVTLFTLLLIAAFPCGRWDEPIEGACATGSALALLSGPNLLIAVLSGIAVALLMAIFNPALANDKNGYGFKNLFSLKTIKSKFFRRDFLLLFIISYVLFSVVAYIYYRNGGLRWFNYAAIYGILAPFLAIWASDVILAKVRHSHKPKL